MDATREQFLEAENSAREILLPQPRSESDISDLRQIAWSIAGSVEVFVTRDQALLSSRDALYQLCGMTVCRPSQLIARIDALHRERAYQPSRLAGTLLGLRQELDIDEGEIAAQFQNSLAGESKTQFLDRIRRLRSKPSASRCLVVRDIGRRVVGLLGYSLEDCRLRIDVLRGARGQLAGSIERYLLLRAVLDASAESLTICEFADPYPSAHLSESLIRERFFRHDDGWTKIVGNENITRENLERFVRECAASCTSGARDRLANFADQIGECFRREEQRSFLAIEDAIWPGRIDDLDIPVFLVAIKPAWAQHLFDEALANEQLFGARPDLALNNESVYYRSARNAGGLTDGARLLWYVSKDDGFVHSGAIRAESRIDEVAYGTVKELYGKFRRLGVYEWQDVVGITNGDPHGRVMAIRFSRTALLQRPVSWESLRKALRSYGIGSTLQSPTEIPIELYSALKSFAS